jgi:hypothetical protein
MIKFLDLQKIKATLKKNKYIEGIYRIVLLFLNYKGMSKKQLISFNKLLTADILGIKILNQNNTTLFYSPPIFDEFDGKPEMFENKKYT